LKGDREALLEEFERWFVNAFGNVSVVYPDELAMVFGKSKSAIYRAIKRGDIPARRWGSRGYMVLKVDLERWYLSGGLSRIDRGQGEGLR